MGNRNCEEARLAVDAVFSQRNRAPYLGYAAPTRWRTSSIDALTRQITLCLNYSLTQLEQADWDAVCVQHLIVA